MSLSLKVVLILCLTLGDYFVLLRLLIMAHCIQCRCYHGVVRAASRRRYLDAQVCRLWDYAPERMLAAMRLHVKSWLAAVDGSRVGVANVA